MDEKELRNALDALKNELETSLTKKGEAQVEKIKSAEEKLEAVEKSLKELEELKSKQPEVKAEDFSKIKSDLDATIKALDILQIRFKNAPEPKSQTKSFNERLADAITESTDDINKLLRKESKGFVVELKEVGDMGTGNVTGGTNYGAITRPGIIANPNTATHIRTALNVLPAGPGTDWYFMRENGAGEGSIAPVSEGAMKPQFDLDLVEASVPFQTIAGWMRITRKALNNIPGITSYLQARLPEKLKDVEDAQILYGDGNAPNIKGILTSGNFTASTATAAQVLVEKIITDMSVLEDTYKRKATAVWLRSAAYYSFFVNKALGSGEYDLPQGVAFVNGGLTILGVPVYSTTSLNSTDYIVGDFANGADLIVQEAMSIGFFEQDGTNVRENKITVRIEETIALPVYGSNYFIKGNSTYTPAT